ncbi:hypothetical protein JCM10212_005597 [Sporobolomyces blumeae]
MSATAPRLSARPPRDQPDAVVPDEPPPAYEATPVNEQTLEYGPLRPFQPPPGPPPPAPFSAASPPPSSSRPYAYAPPTSPPASTPPGQPGYGVGYASHGSNGLGPPSSLPPPTFPFWNGSNLTPAQTGFQEGPVLGRAPSQRLASRPPARPPSSSTTNRYEPTPDPTPGQPLLRQGMLLVYPETRPVCAKCANTGYKPFECGTGYRGDDPSHPCRKCWKNFGKPYNSILRHSITPSSPPPPNYQRPLRLYETPSSNPRPNVVHVPGGGGWGFGGGGWGAGAYGGTGGGGGTASPLVVRPGDPRIGGMLCRTCGGDGLVMGPFIFDEVTCGRCQGTGRVF